MKTDEREKMIYVICNWDSCHKGTGEAEFDRLEQKLIKCSTKEIQKKYDKLKKIAV